MMRKQSEEEERRERFERAFSRGGSVIVGRQIVTKKEDLLEELQAKEPKSGRRRVRPEDRQSQQPEFSAEPEGEAPVPAARSLLASGPAGPGSPAPEGAKP